MLRENNQEGACQKGSSQENSKEEVTDQRLKHSALW
jgi:hypothetical protein